MRKILYGLFIVLILISTLLLVAGCKKKDAGSKNEIDTSKILVGTELLNSVVEGELDEEGTYTQVTIPERLPEEETNKDQIPNTPNVVWGVETVPRRRKRRRNYSSKSKYRWNRLCSK